MGHFVLDFLLIVIVLMMVPIGFFRGGLRELSVSAGLMLGILMAQAWTDRWSGLVQRLFGMGEGSSRFLTSILICFGITALFGYGASAAFNYRPGPGGRLYGAFLALFNALVALGFLLTQWATFLEPDQPENSVTDGFVSRLLIERMDVILLIATIGIGLATIFGMFVRERGDVIPMMPANQPLYRPVTDVKPYMDAGDDRESKDRPEANAAPVRIREVRHWEDEAENPKPDPTRYGTGWRQTWPDSDGPSRPTRKSATSTPSPSRSVQGSGQTDALTDWLKDQDRSRDEPGKTRF